MPCVGGPAYWAPLGNRLSALSSDAMLRVFMPRWIPPGCCAELRSSRSPSSVHHVRSVATRCLQEVRPPAPRVLTAQIAPVIALTALTTLELSDAPVHAPVHARDPDVLSTCYGT